MVNEQHDTQGWESARACVCELGDLSWTFTSCVRCLNSDNFTKHGSVLKNLSLLSEYFVLRLIRSDYFKLRFFLANRTFIEGSDLEFETSKRYEFVSGFSSEDLAALIAVIVLFKRTADLSPGPGCERLLTQIEIYSEAGKAIGDAIPQIGGSLGLIVGGIRYLSFAVMQRALPAKFREYLLHKTRLKVPYDFEFEREIWGYTHDQISAMLLQHVGFGVATAAAFGTGLRGSDVIDAAELEYLILDKQHLLGSSAPKETIWNKRNELGQGDGGLSLAQRVNTARKVIDSLMFSNQISHQTFETMIETSALNSLTAKISRLKTHGSWLGWLRTTRQSLNVRLQGYPSESVKT